MFREITPAETSTVPKGFYCERPRGLPAPWTSVAAPPGPVNFATTHPNLSGAVVAQASLWTAVLPPPPAPSSPPPQAGKNRGRHPAPLPPQLPPPSWHGQSSNGVTGHSHGPRPHVVRGVEMSEVAHETANRKAEAKRASQSEERWTFRCR